MSLTVLWVGLAPRADREVAPVMAQQWQAAQLWMGSGRGLHHLDQVSSVEIGQHPGVRRGSEMTQCPHRLSLEKRSVKF